MRKLARGQGMTEYLVLVIFVAIVLAVPWGSHPPVIVTLLKAIQVFYTHYIHALSVP